MPFEKYAAAAQSLGSPSSAARALYAGAPNIERVDRLVQAIAKQKGMQLPILDEVVGLVDARWKRTRKKAARGRSNNGYCSVPESSLSSIPSSWILRVIVLLPMPRRLAASMRRPPVRASALLMSARSN